MVAMNVWPTDASDGAVTSEARWRKMGRVWAASGVVAGQGGDMAPTLAYPNLTVQAGACWVDGHYCELPGAQVLAVTANGLVVVRFDPAANTADLVYRDGITTPAQSPTGTWELPIAQVAASALVDLRALLGGGGVKATIAHPTLVLKQGATLNSAPTIPSATRYSHWLKRDGWIQATARADSTGAGTTNSLGLVIPAGFEPGFSIDAHVGTGQIWTGGGIRFVSASWPGGAANQTCFVFYLDNTGVWFNNPLASGHAVYVTLSYPAATP
jgi:hypothetical protein